MTRRYLEDLESDASESVDPGTYTVEVVDARPLEGKPFIWLDLKILGGPDDGRVVSVGINVPGDGNGGAIYHFKKKIAAFAPEIAKARVFELDDDDQIEAMADAMMGVKCEATLDIEKQEGPYKGNQQVVSTSQFVDTAGAPGPTRSGRKERSTKLAAVAGDPAPVDEADDDEDGPPF